MIGSRDQFDPLWGWEHSLDLVQVYPATMMYTRARRAALVREQGLAAPHVGLTGRTCIASVHPDRVAAVSNRLLGSGCQHVLGNPVPASFSAVRQPYW
jgi:hypothetical protein